jgi:hypothetical protein
VLPFPRATSCRYVIDRMMRENTVALSSVTSQSASIARLYVYATALVMGVVAAYVGYWLGGL